LSICYEFITTRLRLSGQFENNCSKKTLQFCKLQKKTGNQKNNYTDFRLKKCLETVKAI